MKHLQLTDFQIRRMEANDTDKAPAIGLYGDSGGHLITWTLKA